MDKTSNTIAASAKRSAYTMYRIHFDKQLLFGFCAAVTSDCSLTFDVSWVTVSGLSPPPSVGDFFFRLRIFHSGHFGATPFGKVVWLKICRNVTQALVRLITIHALKCGIATDRVAMGLCKCPKRKVTNLFCYVHKVNVCENCMVEQHPRVRNSRLCYYYTLMF